MNEPIVVHDAGRGPRDGRHVRQIGTTILGYFCLRLDDGSEIHLDPRIIVDINNRYKNTLYRLANGDARFG